MLYVKWLDRWVNDLHAEPEPFACAWCSPGRGKARHDMCTGSAVRPHMESLTPAAVGKCQCALHDHNLPTPRRTPLQRLRNSFHPLPRG